MWCVLLCVGGVIDVCGLAFDVVWCRLVCVSAGCGVCCVVVWCVLRVGCYSVC